MTTLLNNNARAPVLTTSGEPANRSSRFLHLDFFFPLRASIYANLYTYIVSFKLIKEQSKGDMVFLI